MTSGNTGDPWANWPPAPPQAIPYGPSPAAGPPAYGAPAPDDRRPEPGELHIVGRRSWKTWQLLLAVVIAAVLGMAFNGVTGSASGTSASSGSSGGYKLPPPNASTAGGGSSGAGHSSASTTTTTSAGGSTPASGAAGSVTTTTAAASVTQATGPATVLIPSTQQSGNWTSGTFNIAGGAWNIGWAFQCTPVPASTPTFAVFVVNAGASPGSTPAVTSAAASGNAVTPQTSTGSQQIVVQAPPACRWAVKVTGFSG
jgi:hypothetical protein